MDTSDCCGCTSAIIRIYVHEYDDNWFRIDRKGGITIVNTNKLTAQIEGDLIALLDDYHSLGEIWDNELDAQIHRWYADVKPVYPKRPYFSPSAVNSCPRELYVKAKGAERDNQRIQPHQKRWTAIGTAIGDMIQRDLLFIEKHYERLTGNKPRFKFVRNPDGTPMFEDFAKTNALVEHNGEKFYLYGTPDGIMEYITDDGERIRVGLEIKSKQTTPARTSLHSMRNPEISHVKQAVAYGYMYNVDYYVILYVNTAKQNWEMSEEQYEKTPDIRAFAFEITERDITEILDRLAEINKAVRTNTPPPLDLDSWTFNNYKIACARDLSDVEFDELKAQVRRVLRSGLPDWKKQQYYDAFEFIKSVREAE